MDPTSSRRLRTRASTCYGVVNGKPTTYQAKPDINGVLTCSKSQQTAGGVGAGVLHAVPQHAARAHAADR